MSHKRAAIRQACKTALLNTTDAEDRVFTNRAAPMGNMGGFPALVIFATDETGQPFEISDGPTVRSLSLVIDLYCSASDSLDDEIDDLAEVVEGIMGNEGVLGDDAINCILQSTQIEMGYQGENPVGVARLTYGVTYIA